MTHPRDDVERLQRLLDAIEEVALRTPEEELLAEEGPQAKRDEDIARNIVAAHLKAYGLSKREEAKRGMEQARAARAAALGRLPAAPAARRALFERIVANQPALVPQGLTMAFRDGKEITDAEIDSILEALAKVGALPKDGGTE
ncbi:hypothetical protein [Azospirillum canadense]|uniref:hypothetical protein n=1 Tax=Azospirillum canadense TaxID=403962 RepID=UPI00222701C6|nr:hypothetical protein [Azospirillum canadense]MCW2236836.1 hypothetical protein [Azospirillum canadense]